MKKNLTMERKIFEEELEKINSQKEIECETKKLRQNKLQVRNYDFF
jgi:hypothetical protein